MEFRLTEEQEMIKDLARDFARNEIAPVANRFDRKAEFPHDILAKVREVGLINLCIPEEYGGNGLTPVERILVTEELAWGCTGIAVAISVINSLAAEPILLAGTDDQKKKYLGMLSEGLGSYCVTEPNAGSDMASIGTRARGGSRGYELDGQKTWISNAHEASFFVVFAKTDPEAGHHGISAFIVDRDLPGVEVSKKLPKMGQRACDCCEVLFNQVELPTVALLGQEGDGFKLAMRVFDSSRPVIGALSVGLSQRALDESLRFAKEREAFGQPILGFQGVGFKIAEMGMRTQASRLLTYHAAYKNAVGERNTLEASYAKTFASDTAMWAATEAVQIHGGYGYSEEYPVEKLMRDAKVLQIYEGTNEIQRLIMVRELSK
ncbi:MAG: acyl-CoA dehydrogenase family protein [Deltaproteobacteria bacterium]|nr:acyl-CoA dehydrogenase family protein [Deltaproteobacteria bacterium]